jgi:hypothetical protein
MMLSICLVCLLARTSTTSPLAARRLWMRHKALATTYNKNHNDKQSSHDNDDNTTEQQKQLPT